MPIKNFMDGEVQYLMQYEPFGIPAGQVEPTSVNEMISMDVQPANIPTVINYSIGAEGDYEFIINMKNLTNNATLDVIVPIPPQIFVSYQTKILPGTGNVPDRRVIDITLLPQQQEQIRIILNKNFLNTQSNFAKFESNIPISVRSRVNNSIITKNINVSTLQQTVLPSNVNVN